MILCTFYECEDSKQVSYVIRALNYHNGLQDFTTVIICKFESIFEVASSLKADYVQVTVCGISARHSGMYSSVATIWKFLMSCVMEIYIMI